MFECSVIVCTHNPRTLYLRRTIDALREQTLPRNSWELLLIDNASDAPLESLWDISWHPHARHIREDQLGLTYARFAGINQARADLFIFVDDDNVLQSDYLEHACRIAREFSHIGAFGGTIKGEFETPVPDWAEPYLEGLCIKEITRDRWSNDYAWTDAVPYGAGMCVRSAVARRYRDDIQHEVLRRGLDRSGGQLTSAGDLDMAWTAIDLGLGTGRFQSLKVVHLIPSGRLTEDYLVRLNAGFSYSNNIIWAARGLIKGRPVYGFRDKLRHWTSCLRLRGIRRRMYFASREATQAAWRTLDAENARRSQRSPGKPTTNITEQSRN